jgi:hypothetical protein
VPGVGAAAPTVEGDQSPGAADAGAFGAAGFDAPQITLGLFLGAPDQEQSDGQTPHAPSGAGTGL